MLRLLLDLLTLIPVKIKLSELNHRVQGHLLLLLEHELLPQGPEFSHKRPHIIAFRTSIFNCNLSITENKRNRKKEIQSEQSFLTGD